MEGNSTTEDQVDDISISLANGDNADDADSWDGALTPPTRPASASADHPPDLMWEPGLGQFASCRAIGTPSADDDETDQSMVSSDDSKSTIRGLNYRDTGNYEDVVSADIATSDWRPAISGHMQQTLRPSPLSSPLSSLLFFVNPHLQSMVLDDSSSSSNGESDIRRQVVDATLVQDKDEKLNTSFDTLYKLAKVHKRDFLTRQDISLLRASRHIDPEGVPFTFDLGVNTKILSKSHGIVVEHVLYKGSLDQFATLLFAQSLYTIPISNDAPMRCDMKDTFPARFEGQYSHFAFCTNLFARSSERLLTEATEFFGQRAISISASCLRVQQLEVFMDRTFQRFTYECARHSAGHRYTSHRNLIDEGKDVNMEGEFDFDTLAEDNGIIFMPFRGTEFDDETYHYRRSWTPAVGCNAATVVQRADPSSTTHQAQLPSSDASVSTSAQSKSKKARLKKRKQNARRAAQIVGDDQTVDEEEPPQQTEKRSHIRMKDHNPEQSNVMSEECNHDTRPADSSEHTTKTAEKDALQISDELLDLHDNEAITPSHVILSRNDDELVEELFKQHTTRINNDVLDILSCDIGSPTQSNDGKCLVIDDGPAPTNVQTAIHCTMDETPIEVPRSPSTRGGARSQLVKTPHFSTGEAPSGCSTADNMIGTSQSILVPDNKPLNTIAAVGNSSVLQSISTLTKNTDADAQVQAGDYGIHHKVSRSVHMLEGSRLVDFASTTADLRSKPVPSMKSARSSQAEEKKESQVRENHVKKVRRDSILKLKESTRSRANSIASQLVVQNNPAELPAFVASGGPGVHDHLTISDGLHSTHQNPIPDITEAYATNYASAATDKEVAIALDEIATGMSDKIAKLSLDSPENTIPAADHVGSAIPSDHQPDDSDFNMQAHIIKDEENEFLKLRMRMKASPLPELYETCAFEPKAVAKKHNSKRTKKKGKAIPAFSVGHEKNGRPTFATQPPLDTTQESVMRTSAADASQQSTEAVEIGTNDVVSDLETLSVTTAILPEDFVDGDQQPVSKIVPTPLEGNSFIVVSRHFMKAKGAHWQPALKNAVPHSSGYRSPSHMPFRGHVSPVQPSSQRLEILNKPNDFPALPTQGPANELSSKRPALSSVVSLESPAGTTVPEAMAGAAEPLLSVSKTSQEFRAYEEELQVGPIMSRIKKSSKTKKNNKFGQVNSLVTKTSSESIESGPSDGPVELLSTGPAQIDIEAAVTTGFAANVKTMAQIARSGLERFDRTIHVLPATMVVATTSDEPTSSKTISPDEPQSPREIVDIVTPVQDLAIDSLIPRNASDRSHALEAVVSGRNPGPVTLPMTAAIEDIRTTAPLLENIASGLTTSHALTVPTALPRPHTSEPIDVTSTDYGPPRSYQVHSHEQNHENSIQNAASGMIGNRDLQSDMFTWRTPIPDVYRTDAGFRPYLPAPMGIFDHPHLNKPQHDPEPTFCRNCKLAVSENEEVLDKHWSTVKEGFACAGCGPVGVVRYCTLECLLADSMVHYRYCRSDLQIPRWPIWGLETIRPDGHPVWPITHHGFAIRPLIKESAECFRQITYTSWLGRYGIMAPFKLEYNRATAEEKGAAVRISDDLVTKSIEAGGDYFIFTSASQTACSLEKHIIEYVVRLTQHAQYFFRRLRNAAFFTQDRMYVKHLYQFIYHYLVEVDSSQISLAGRSDLLSMFREQFELEFGYKYECRSANNTSTYLDQSWTMPRAQIDLEGAMFDAEVRSPILRMWHPNTAGNEYLFQPESPWSRYRQGFGYNKNWAFDSHGVSRPHFMPGSLLDEPWPVARGWLNPHPEVVRGDLNRLYKQRCDLAYTRYALQCGPSSYGLAQNRGEDTSRAQVGAMQVEPTSESPDFFVQDPESMNEEGSFLISNYGPPLYQDTYVAQKRSSTNRSLPIVPGVSHGWAHIPVNPVPMTMANANILQYQSSDPPQQSISGPLRPAGVLEGFATHHRTFQSGSSVFRSSAGPPHAYDAPRMGTLSGPLPGPTALYMGTPPGPRSINHYNSHTRCLNGYQQGVNNHIGNQMHGNAPPTYATPRLYNPYQFNSTHPAYSSYNHLYRGHATTPEARSTAGLRLRPDTREWSNIGRGMSGILSAGRGGPDTPGPRGTSAGHSGKDSNRLVDSQSEPDRSGISSSRGEHNRTRRGRVARFRGHGRRSVAGERMDG